MLFWYESLILVLVILPHKKCKLYWYNFDSSKSLHMNIRFGFGYFETINYIINSYKLFLMLHCLLCFYCLSIF